MKKKNPNPAVAGKKKSANKSAALAKAKAAKAPIKKSAGSSSGVTKIVHARSDYFKSVNKLLLVSALVGMISLCVSAFALLLATNKSEVVRFVAVNEQGQLINMVALNQPNQSDAAVLQWATEAIIETFSFDAYDINYVLNKATQEYFTESGANALLNEVKNSGNFDAVVEQGLDVSLALEHSPFMVNKENLSNGLYAWNILAPAVITYRTGKNTFTNRVNIELQVSRRSLLENQSGLGINKILWTNQNR